MEMDSIMVLEVRSPQPVSEDREQAFSLPFQVHKRLAGFPESPWPYDTPTRDSIISVALTLFLCYKDPCGYTGPTGYSSQNL